ncbi:MAG: hypothetical protein EHM20_05265 [Alphaproteobacteria bacterium]|nr:MAG: hypothetical protein EHM20_05265 [Alphaproteobacteria bacterium]
MKKTIFISLFIITITIGCSTQYKKMDKKYGYTDEKINDGLYQITFKGNSRTSDELVHKYFLRRSAEVALKNRYQYFTVVETEDITQHTTVTSAGVPATKARLKTYTYSGDIKYTPTEYKTIHNHALTGKIQLHKEGEQPMNAYSVEKILKDVKL